MAVKRVELRGLKVAQVWLTASCVVVLECMANTTVVVHVVKKTLKGEACNHGRECTTHMYAVTERGACTNDAHGQKCFGAWLTKRDFGASAHSKSLRRTWRFWVISWSISSNTTTSIGDVTVGVFCRYFSLALSFFSMLVPSSISFSPVTASQSALCMASGVVNSVPVNAWKAGVGILPCRKKRGTEPNARRLNIQALATRKEG